MVDGLLPTDVSKALCLSPVPLSVGQYSLLRFPSVQFQLSPSLSPLISFSLTTVRVDAAVVQESDSQVVQHGRLVEEAEGSQIVLALQDVGVPQRWEISGRRHWVI